MIISPISYPTAYAASDNQVTKAPTVKPDDKFNNPTTAPALRIEERDVNEFGTEKQLFQLKLKNAKWLKNSNFSGRTFKEEMERLCKGLTIGKTSDTTVDAAVYNGTANRTDKLIFTIPMLVGVQEEGAVQAEVYAKDSAISSGNYTIANVIKESIEENPAISVAEAIANNSGKAIVEGYIVGTVKGVNSYEFEKFSKNTNLALADSKDERDASKILNIQLPSGKLRNEWNLKDHPEKVGSKVQIIGNLEKYFGTHPGLKSPTEISLVKGDIPKETKVTANVQSGSEVLVNTQVKLNATTSDATIYYVEYEGNTYDKNKFKAYTKDTKIIINKAKNIAAYAVKKDGQQSKMFTFTYTVKKINGKTIAEVRAQKTGDVKFKGIVTCVTNKGAYVQDHTAAIYLYKYDINKELHEGDEVEVIGKLKEYAGLLEVVNFTATVKSKNHSVVPKEITIQEVGENYESMLVKLKDVALGQINTGGDTSVTDATGSINIYKIPDGVLDGFTKYDLVALVSEHNGYQLAIASKNDVIPTEGVQKPNKIIVKEGETPTFAKTIAYVSKDKKILSAKVIWDTSHLDINKIGTYIIKGKLEETALTTSVEVVVISSQGVKIRHIQGKTHTSSLKGQDVADVEGVVTIVDGSYGFYMQDPNPDSDEGTSEGIYVFSKYLKPAVTLRIGDKVKVSGTVDEHIKTENFFGFNKDIQLTATQIKATKVEVVDHGNDLPAPIVIGEGGRIPPNKVIDNDEFKKFDPKEDSIDFYESLEGMRVKVDHALVVGGNKYNEIPVVPNKGKYSTNGLSVQGGVIVTKDNMHPERIFIAKGAEKFQPSVKVGDIFEGAIVGVIGYSTTNYKLFVSEKLPKVVKADYDENEVTRIVPKENGLRIASFNIENCGGDAKEDKIQKIAEVVAKNLKCPDIVGFIEVQDNDGAKNNGVIEANKVYERIIQAVESKAGDKNIQYAYTDIAPEDGKDGGQPGGNIRVGFIYRTDRVKLAQKKKGDATTAVQVVKEKDGKIGLSLNPGRIDPNNNAFERTRKSLATEFIFKGEKVFVIANHFSSKRGDDSMYGNKQPARLNSEDYRIPQARVVNNFVKELLAKNPKAKIVALGDMNDFEFSNPLNALAGNELFNMIQALPKNERYTYNYQGNSQVLDNILVTKYLKDQTEIDIVNINSFKPKHEQLSDHDAVMVQVDMKKSSSTESSSGGSSGSSSGSNSSTANEKEDDQSIEKALKNKKEVKISLKDKKEKRAHISEAALKRLVKADKPLKIENKGISLVFRKQALQMKEVEQEGEEVALEISAKEIDETSKKEILSKIEKDKNFYQVDSQVFELSCAVVNKKGTTKVSNFKEPVAVAIDLSGKNLSKEEIKNLTGIRYKKDEKGNITLVKLGGIYDEATKTFTFYTDQFSQYGVLKAKELRKINLTIEDQYADINNTTNTLDAPPTIMNGRTMVPLRFVAEALGANVGWVGETKTVKLDIDDKKLNLVIGKKEQGMDVPAIIKDGRTLVPVRYVSENLGANVLWFPSSKKIEIVK
jgi:predicted extracellular nuclease